MKAVVATRAAAHLASIRLTSLLVAGATAAAGSSPQPAQPELQRETRLEEPADTRPILTGTITHDRVMWDAPGDGSLWARGATYKASFDARGAIFYPAFGPRSPRTMPHALSPDAVTVGGMSLEFDREAYSNRDGDRTQFDRGTFTEVYDLVPGSMEQSFVFDALPRAGDLVLHIPVGSELEASTTNSGIEFSGEFGRVTYGLATAIDAAGQRTSASTTVADGAITIRVDAGFLAHAVLPLVVDPIVATLAIPFLGTDNFSADISYDPHNLVWFAVYEDTFSSTDTDVYCAMLYASGAYLNNASIDFTTDKWEAPRCAYNGAAHQILVVAAVTTGSVRWIKGRTAEMSGTSIFTGPQFVVSGTDSGIKTAPDVGADSFPSGSTYYCVAYTRTNPGGWTEIGISMILPNSGFGPAFYLPGAGSFANDSEPSVSKSNGGDQFLVAWRRFGNMALGDIYGAHLSYFGFLADGPFGITSSHPDDDRRPCASSPIDGTHQAVVTFERSAILSSNHDIWVSAISDTTVLDTKNLITLEGTGLEANDQIEPSIDCDGRHFLVAYSEFFPPWSTYNVFADELYLTGTTIGLRQVHDLIQYNTSYGVRRANVAAVRSPSSWSNYYGIVYDIGSSGSTRYVEGRQYTAIDGGTAVAYCTGDGFGTACPCGNSGGFGRGCANSIDVNGAALYVASGTASTLADDVVIQCNGMPSTVACLFFQGTSLLAGTPFGDGLRCAGGSIVRLATKTAVGGMASYPEAGNLSITAKGGITIDGGRRGYQVWYRNAASFCTAATYNLSNGLRIDWAR